MNQHEEAMTGGRMTAGVVRIGDTVHRPACENAAFVHRVLNHLVQKNNPHAPKYLGWDSHGREVLSYLPGSVPDNLGSFTLEQCVRAAGIIRALHDDLSDFPDCPEGQTVCHNDLSPCNFTFRSDVPAGVIDWDAAAFGDPIDDLSYAAWMWLDIGSAGNDPARVRAGILAMSEAYGLHGQRIRPKMLEQIDRVGASIFPTPEQTAATRSWTQQCRVRLLNFMQDNPDL